MLRLPFGNEGIKVHLKTPTLSFQRHLIRSQEKLQLENILSFNTRLSFAVFTASICSISLGAPFCGAMTHFFLREH